jgi:hypothetical protein
MYHSNREFCQDNDLLRVLVPRKKIKEDQLNTYFALSLFYNTRGHIFLLKTWNRFRSIFYLTEMIASVIYLLTCKC